MKGNLWAESALEETLTRAPKASKGFDYLNVDRKQDVLIRHLLRSNAIVARIVPQQELLSSI